MPETGDIIKELERVLETAELNIPEGVSKDQKYPFLAGYFKGSIKCIIKKYSKEAKA